jgi:hypothetical protein
MSGLGALLELIHDAHCRVTTFEAEYRDWSRPRPSLQLRVNHSEPSHTQARWRGAGPFPKAVASTRRIWLMAPDRLRIEVLNRHQLVRLGVLTNWRWWWWERGEEAISSELLLGEHGAAAPPPPMLTPPLIDPARLLPMFRFKVVGHAVRIGRKVVSARALPRHPQPAMQALCYEFEFDAQHGTVLRRAALDDGHIVNVTEATAVMYASRIDPERFVFTSPDGQAIRDIRSEAMAVGAASGPRASRAAVERVRRG